MKSGIYKIQNLLNGKVYIGSSKNLKQRLRQHKNQLLYNKHGNNHLQSSYNKYGKDNFTFEIIQYVIENELINQEIKYIKLFKALNPKQGYNKATNIVNTSGYKWSKESRLKLSNSKQGVKIHPNTLKALIEANKNRIYKKGCNLNKEGIQKIVDKNSKPILQYSLEGEFIKEYKSATIAAQLLNVNRRSIHACARGDRDYAYGFQWFRKINNIFPLIIPKYKRKHTNYNKFLSLCSEMNIEKQGELLENPTSLEDNQQLSLDSNIFESSTTNSQVQTSNVEDSNANTSALPFEIDSNGFTTIYCNDIIVKWKPIKGIDY